VIFFFGQIGGVVDPAPAHLPTNQYIGKTFALAAILAVSLLKSRPLYIRPAVVIRAASLTLGPW